MDVAGLFAGVGGLELGLERAGHRTTVLCECDPMAVSVLRRTFGLEVHSDVRDLGPVRADLVAAGFPCQDLSFAGPRVGMDGAKSSLVSHVFRVVDASPSVRHVLLENVPFMLKLNGGAAMRYLTEEFESRGFAWAYRTVDSRAFGLPQRRHRVVVLASLDLDPCTVLFQGNYDLNWDHPYRDRHDAFGALPFDPPSPWCGFYWTEGKRGLGWAVSSVPTIRGGSGVGIPSPPAVIDPTEGVVGTPDIRDLERLQGFAEGHLAGTGRSAFRLVGNAVSVPVAAWVGKALANPGEHPAGSVVMPDKWPMAAMGHRGKKRAVLFGLWPEDPNLRYAALREFLRYPLRPLSQRALAGFLRRTEASTLRFPVGFLAALRSLEAV